MFERRTANGGMYRKLIISVGRRQKIAPNHVVSAVCERTDLSGKEIGKIEIYDDKTIVGVPADRAEQVVRALRGLKINGAPATVRLSSEKASASPRPGMRRNPRNAAPRQDFVPQRVPADADASDAPQPVRRGKLRISESAKARLLDGRDLSRFEIRKPRETGLKSASDFHGRRSEGRGDHRRDEGRRGNRDGRGSRKNSDRGSLRRGKR